MEMKRKHGFAWAAAVMGVVVALLAVALAVPAQAADTVTVTLNANGATFNVTGRTDSPDTVTVDFEVGQTFSEALSAAGLDTTITINDPANKAFMGYAASADAGADDAIDWDTVVDSSFPTTLYIVWGDAVNVTFHANGSDVTLDGGSNESVTWTLAKGYSLGDYYGFPDAQRDGYVLVGWATTADGTYEDAGWFFDLDEDLDLYAIWYVGKTVTFHGNGGTYLIWDDEAQGEVSVDSLDFDVAIGAPLWSSCPWPSERDGYEFVGYATSPDASADEVLDFEAVVSGDIASDLYAIWLGGDGSSADGTSDGTGAISTTTTTAANIPPTGDEAAAPVLLASLAGLALCGTGLLVQRRQRG